jgi:2-C-methyl-D-erythritol 2,4-cyclodiphosphate synthase
MKVGLGQDSHKFNIEKTDKKCVIGGVVFPDMPGLDADSDGDVVYHAICNAITSVTHVHILGDIAIQMCKQGIKDSKEYLKKAKKSLGEKKISHLSISLEGARPRMQASLLEMRKNIARDLEIDESLVGITCTSGNSMGDFGKGIGLQCLCILTIF